MADYFLLNSVQFGARLVQAGTKVSNTTDTAYYNALLASGASFWLASDPTVAAAAAVVASRVRQGQDTMGNTIIMTNAALQSAQVTLNTLLGYFASGITGAQISSTAGIVGTQLSATAAIAGSQLSATAGIVGTQLSATAAIAGSQLAAAAQIAVTQLSTALQTQLTALSVPRWIDLFGDITQGTASASLTYEAYRDTAHQMFWFINDQTDQLYMRYQMPHGFVIGSQVRPHVHVLPVSTIVADQNVRMTLAYAWGETGNAIPANTGWVSADYDLPVAVAGQYIPHRLNGPLITAPAWVTGSSYLLCTWTNKVGDAAYTYKTNKSGGTVKANLGLLGADCHVQIGSLGSVNEAP